jgi:hypothetical protein
MKIRMGVGPEAPPAGLALAPPANKGLQADAKSRKNSGNVIPFIFFLQKKEIYAYPVSSYPDRIDAWYTLNL